MQMKKPNPDLRNFEKLIGTWQLTGNINGTSTYEWAEGKFFLLHNFEFAQDGNPYKGIEIIGHERGMGAEPGDEIKTRIYGFTDGLTQDYVYEVNSPHTYIVWLGKKGRQLL